MIQRNIVLTSTVILAIFVRSGTFSVDNESDDVANALVSLFTAAQVGPLNVINALQVKTWKDKTTVEHMFHLTSPKASQLTVTVMSL